MKTKRHDSILADARRQFAAKRRGRKFSHLFEAKKHNWKLIIPIVAGLIFFVNYSALISKKSHPISSFLDFFINFFLGKLAISPYILMYFFSLLSSESPPLLEPEMPYNSISDLPYIFSLLKVYIEIKINITYQHLYYSSLSLRRTPRDQTSNSC